MNCPVCGARLAPGTQFCQSCGARVNMSSAPVYTNNYYVQRDAIPPEYRPLSPWAYFGLSLLFSIPLIGLIFLIIYTFNGDNINRRNFARSYWCALLLVIIVTVILAATGVLAELAASSAGYF